MEIITWKIDRHYRQAKAFYLTNLQIFDKIPWNQKLKFLREINRFHEIIFKWDEILLFPYLDPVILVSRKNIWMIFFRQINLWFGWNLCSSWFHRKISKDDRFRCVLEIISFQYSTYHKILINFSQHSILVRFPIKNS